MVPKNLYPWGCEELLCKNNKKTTNITVKSIILDIADMNFGMVDMNGYTPDALRLGMGKDNM